jgi:N-acetylglucosaminyldiphosphoundecaprenol N-acetyl-beta-D-mannosaminyltransferase
MRTDVLGIGFDNVTMSEAVEKASELINEDGFKYIVTPNPEIVWMCRKDSELKETIEGAAMVIPDGIGIIYGAKILGRPLKEKVPGADFAEEFFDVLAKTDKTVYLLGAKPGVAELAAQKLTQRHPGLKVCGTADGYFKDDDAVIEKINKAEPDLLLVCLGAPKQELWMKKNGSKLKTKLAIGLGGSLDVYAGVVERAPAKWQKLNLEWLYRLIKQPSRLGRQMRLPAFLFAVIWQRIRGK